MKTPHAPVDNLVIVLTIGKLWLIVTNYQESYFECRILEEMAQVASWMAADSGCKDQRGHKASPAESRSIQEIRQL